MGDIKVFKVIRDFKGLVKAMGRLTKSCILKKYSCIHL